MAIAVDATTVRNMADTESGAITVSHTVTGSNRYLLVGFLQGSTDYGLTFSSAPTYSGVSLSELTNSTNVAANVRVWVYGLVAPATGANNLAFTYNAASAGRTVIAIRSFTGVHQSTPLGTIVPATASGGTRTVDVASAVDELVVDMGLNRLGGTVTVGAGQTQRVNQASAVGDQVGVSSDEAGAATVTMSWTSTGGDEWVLVGFPLKPAINETTLYFLDSAASGSNFGQLQVGGSAPATATTATGWTVDTVGATNYALMAYASERLSTTFSGTAQPAGNPDNSLGDCFRSTSTLTGDFATGAWTIAVPVIAVSAAAGQDGRVRVRLWKSSNATGTSPTEITAGAVAGTTVTNLTTGAEQVSTVTTASITGFSMTNEYLFVQIAWEITGAAT